MTAQPTTNSTGLLIDSIRKSYGQNVVLDDLTIDVERGKLVSLLGPSGCGKTTTLNMIAGFDVPDSGSITLGGEEITSQPPNKRDTAIVFQNYALFPHMTVYKNVSYGLRVRKFDKQAIAARVGTVLDLLDIGRLKDRYPAELSGGQQQRVSLARAIAVQPSLLLLDEPLSNLDTKLRQDIRIEIRKLQQELQQTAVFVTHDQEEALVISDYIAVLNKGTLEQYGTPSELWETPQTVYVADFMGVENILALREGAAGSTLAVPGQGAGTHVPSQVEGYSHVGFRPSSARLINTDAEAPGGSLAIPGKVTGKAYMGTHFRYTCDIGAGAELHLEVDQAYDDLQLDPGEEVRVVVSASGLLPLHESLGRDSAASELSAAGAGAQS